MSTEQPKLQRSLSLFQGTVLNMIDMVGIGPFVTLPIVIGLMGGMFLYAWIAGAILSLVDAMIWSELGAAYPLAGGSYNFLKEAYGKNGMGKMMSFLYVWQTVIQAPLVAASAAIGFSQYLGYLIHLDEWQAKAVSGVVIIFITLLLYRKIDSIGKIGVLLWMGVLLTIGWIIFGGIANGNFLQPLHQISTDFSWGQLASFAFGQACVKTIYSYLGYYNVCHLGGEIKDPGKNIPRSMFISAIGIGILYMAMNMSVSSVISWQEIKHWQDTGQNNFVVSTFIERLYGTGAAKLATVMILWVALASLFAVMLGYSRVPYAAAVDGAFFKVFAKLHPTKNFPYVSLLVLAGFAFVFSLLFKMKHIIDGILAMRIMIQFIGQAVGITLLRKRNGTTGLPYKMPLYPLPVIMAVLMWLFVFYATGLTSIVSFLLVFGSGLVVYLISSGINNYWPFNSGNKTEK
ncbi:APC family permease [Ferruginibacter lapsinanis]|uniref:APC family permease n=1 Tax=Ferruginibacter lapsinanis TaxID=563172 RepID=UPI001E4A777A|nr:APC family permease [Ferruginibacter lapsinanis]UEG49918.1 APC family permease [Ferruginibacter lapsinanis]